MTNYLSGGPVRDVTLDLGEVSYFDSTAAAVIAQTRLRLEKQGSHVRLINVKPEVQGLFEILNLESLLSEGD
ncbi:MAG: STAS domain-containing protein, partial [Planctomycetota bacterium]